MHISHPGSLLKLHTFWVTDNTVWNVKMATPNGVKYFLHHTCIFHICTMHSFKMCLNNKMNGWLPLFGFTGAFGMSELFPVMSIFWSDVGTVCVFLQDVMVSRWVSSKERSEQEDIWLTGEGAWSTNERRGTCTWCWDNNTVHLIDKRQQLREIWNWNKYIFKKKKISR